LDQRNQVFFSLKTYCPKTLGEKACRQAAIACCLSLWAMTRIAFADDSGFLVNPGFEEASADGAPSGWTVISGLDTHGYGSPGYKTGFDAVVPTTSAGGHFSSRCLCFPSQGTWSCPIFTHSNGDGSGIDGRQLGKAAVYQTVPLPAGRHRFSAWLRTAEGSLYSAAFSLGVNLGPPAAYAHDDSTGIRWTGRDLAMSRSFLRDARSRGEWSRYETEPFELRQAGSATVWIRFNYANENQMQARWQADDAAILPAEPVDPEASKGKITCSARRRPVRFRQIAGDREECLLEAGASSLVDARQVRLFRRARHIPAGGAVKYRFPGFKSSDRVSLLVAASGDVIVEANGIVVRSRSGHPDLPTTREWSLPSAVASTDRLDVMVRPAGEHPARLFELELGSPGRSCTRLLHVEADAVAVPWIVGSWDASSREFGGKSGAVGNPTEIRVEQLAPGGSWELHFHHAPVPGHHYYLIHGLLKGTSRIDVGADGLVDWVAETKGEQIVDFDATSLLKSGTNKVRFETDGEHDFAALVETCPGAIDLGRLRLAFEGDQLATVFTRVVDNTWFWLRELHYEPSGFIDASVPRGHWYSQYWPVDIAFALREWVRWGYAEESLRTAAMISEGGWHGHESNRSGGSDNTGGNIAALQLCEVLRRADGQLPSASAEAIWNRIQTHCDEAIDAAAKSPFGLIRGTNWENAGNRENGPCYALSTNLGAAAVLRKAAVIAERRGGSATAARWKSAADNLRQTVLQRLVLRGDHRCPSGFVLPKGTWAYGLRTDGSIEDRPLAGYFWAGGDPADVEGLIAEDGDLLAVYDRTLQAALPLFELKGRGPVSGYAASYDGPDATLVLAALCDRIDAMHPLLRCLAGETDSVEDRGSTVAELSRWAYGPPNGTEDTNLVCAAGFLWSLRMLAGVDDLLTNKRQLRLVPRLPWNWNRLTLNDWPVRARDAQGRPRWTRLGFEMQRDARSASGRVTTADEVPGLELRLGPFARDVSDVLLTVGERKSEVRTEISGDAAWAWLRLDGGPAGINWQAVER